MKILIFLLITFCTINGNSQIIEATLTKEFAIKQDYNLKQDFNFKFLKIGDYYYRGEINIDYLEFYRIKDLSKRKFVLAIRQYDKDMVEKKVFLFNNGEPISLPYLPYLFSQKDKLCIMHYNYEGNENIRNFISRINTNDMTLDVTKEIETVDKQPIIGNNFETTYSPDGSKQLLTFSGEKMISTLIIDDNMNISQLSKLSVPKKLKFEVFSTCLDKNGNKYFTYAYKEDVNDDYQKSGIGVEKKDGKVSFDDFIESKLALDMYLPRLKNSKDGSKVYLEGSYALQNDKAGLYDGIALITFNPANAQMDKPKLFPYPDDLKEKLYRWDMANKKKGVIAVFRAKYELNELDNGTIVLSGYLGKIEQITGSVMAIFITKENKVKFSMVPRSQRGWTIPTVATIPYNNKIIVIYATNEKNLTKDPTEKPSSDDVHKEMCMAAAIFDENGNLQDRKLILQKPGKDRYYALNMSTYYSSNSLIIPIIKDRKNMIDYYMEFYGFVDLKVK